MVLLKISKSLHVEFFLEPHNGTTSKWLFTAFFKKERKERSITEFLIFIFTYCCCIDKDHFLHFPGCQKTERWMVWRKEAVELQWASTTSTTAWAAGRDSSANRRRRVKTSLSTSSEFLSFPLSLSEKDNLDMLVLHIVNTFISQTLSHSFLDPNIGNLTLTQKFYDSVMYCVYCSRRPQYHHCHKQLFIAVINMSAKRETEVKVLLKTAGCITQTTPSCSKLGYCYEHKPHMVVTEVSFFNSDLKHSNSVHIVH